MHVHCPPATAGLASGAMLIAGASRGKRHAIQVARTTGHEAGGLRRRLASRMSATCLLARRLRVMTPRVSVAIAAAIAAAAALPTAAQASSKTCSLPKAAKVTRVTPLVIVYRLPNVTPESPGYPAISVSYRLMACLRSVNKRRVLDPEIGHRLGGAGSDRALTTLSVSGRFVSFMTQMDDSYDSHYLRLIVADLKTGEQVDMGVSGEGADAARGLRLSPNGRVVFVVNKVNPLRPSGPAEVGLWSVQARKFELLEAGAGPFDASFTSSGGVRWASPSGQQEASLAAALDRP